MNTLRLFAPFAALPVIFLLAVALLFVGHRRKAAAVGVGALAVSLLIGFWAITRSRSSTAGIGFLFLPSFAAACGMLGAAYAVGHSSRFRFLRIASCLCLVAASALVCLQIWSGVEWILINRQRDAAYRTTR